MKNKTVAILCKFRFIKGVKKKLIEAQMALAIVAVESTLGKSRVRLNAAYNLIGRTVIIDVSNMVGEHIAQVFTGLVTYRFGEEKFSVERIKSKS